MKYALIISGVLVLFAAVMLACGGGGGGGGETVSSTAQTSVLLPPDIEDQNLVDNAAYTLEVPALLSGLASGSAFELISAPSGMTIDSSGVIRWIPSSQQGAYTVVLKITEPNGKLHEYTFSITVISPDANMPPSIDSISDQIAAVGQAFTLQVVATDLHTPLTYAVSGQPDGMAISASGLISWTPSSSQVDISYPVSVQVKDRYGKASTESFYIGARSDLPYISGFGPLVASFGQAMTYSDIAVYSDYTPLTFALENNPSGMTIDGNGMISWTPTSGQTGQSYTPRVKATDSRGMTGTRDFVVTVGNLPPVIDTAGLPSQAPAGELFQYQVVATDPNTPLAYTFVSGPTGMTLSSGGMISWTPTELGGPYNVKIKVSDSFSAVSELQFSISSVNGVPNITSIPPQSATVSVLLQIQVVATDDDTPLTYSLKSPPSGMTIDGGTGLIEWTPSNQQEGLTYNVEVDVTDSLGGKNSRVFPVTVANMAPQITAVGAQTLDVLVPYTLQLTVFDNNPSLTYSLQNNPAGMTIDQNGKISWTPPNTEQAQSYVVTVKVLDAHETNPLQQTMVINYDVNNINPIMTDIPDQVEGAGYNFSLDASAYVNVAVEPNLPLVYSIVQPLPADGNGVMAIDSGTGAITWTPVNPGGPYAITVQVEDSEGGMSSKTFNITVQAMAIRAIVATPSGSINGDITISYDLFDSGNLDITVEFSINGGGAYAPATEGVGGDGTTNLVSSAPPGGTAHTFVWDSLSDIGFAVYNNVKVRITPSGAGAVAGETEVFTVDNSVHLEVTEIVPGAKFSDSFVLPYKLNGPTVPGGVALQIKYTTDGSSYSDATQLSTYGNAKTINPDNVNFGRFSFVWDTLTDLGTTNNNLVKMKVIVPPAYGGGMEATTFTFKVYNNTGVAATPWPKRHGPHLGNNGRSSFSGPRTNNLKWSSEVWVQYGTPIIGSDGTIYVGGREPGGSQRRGLFAVNPWDGSIKWFLDCAQATYPITGGAIGRNNRIYYPMYGTYGGNTWYHLYCLNDTGAAASVNWTYNLLYIESPTHTPNIDTDGTIYISARNASSYEHILAITDNGGNGSLKWDGYCPVNSSSMSNRCTPAISTVNNAVYATRSNWAYAYGMSRTNGASTGNTGTSYGYSGSVVVDDDEGSIYSIDGGYLRRFNTASSGAYWNGAYNYTSGYSNTPVIGYNGTIYQGGNNGIYGYNSGGSQIFSFGTANAIRGDDMLVDKDGYIYVIALQYAQCLRDNGDGSGTSIWSYSSLQNTSWRGTALGSDGCWIVPGGYDNASYKLRCFGTAGPAVAEVTPSFARNSDTIKIKIYGGGFKALNGTNATQVKLKKGASETILGALNVVNYTTIEADVPSGIAVGEYDVIVTTADGSNTSSAMKVTIEE